MIINDDIRKAVDVMRRGGVIAYPTDTVWGIGCDATNSAAVRRVYDIKRRSDSKALITLVSDEAMLRRHTECDPTEVLKLICSSSRPTTVVYPDARNLAPELLADDGSVGLRITSEAVSKALCETLGGPVVSTSANISGLPAPALYADISEEILRAVDYVMEARRGDMSRSRPSMVLRLAPDGSGIEVIRR